MKAHQTVLPALLLGTVACGFGVAPQQGVTVTVSPSSAVLQTGASQRFQVAVAGATDQGVVWSISEAGGGTIAGDGTYTAPSTPGTYHVMATSHADVTKSGSAIVTVTAPGAGGMVISSALTLDKSYVQAGQTLNGSVTYKNT